MLISQIDVEVSMMISFAEKMTISSIVKLTEIFYAA